VTRAGQETILHYFEGYTDGGYPVGDLVLEGNRLYGAAQLGGSGGRTCDIFLECGIVFEVKLH